MQHLTEPLQRAGLSEREARVYVAALSLGSATAQQISNAAQVTRTTAYHVIDALSEMGLMSSVNQKGGRHFIPAGPRRVVEIMEQRANELVRHVQDVQSVLPELLAFENVDANRPRVYMYEGKEGMRQLSRRVEEVEEGFIEIVPLDAVREFYAANETEDHKRKMTRNGIHGRVLIVAEEAPIDTMREVHAAHGWEMRYIGPSEAPLRGHVTVKGSEIYGFAYEGMPMGVVIDNAHLADALRMLFGLAWEKACDVPVQYPRRRASRADDADDRNDQ